MTNISAVTCSIAVTCISLFSSSLQALDVDIDTKKPVSCEFSNLHQNRIAVEGGSIGKVICLDPRVETVMEEQSGQAFVYLNDLVEGTVTISFVTSGGYLQDLAVNFEDKNQSQVVVLHEPHEEDPAILSMVSPVDRAVIALKSVLKGEAPRGFFPYESSEKREFISKDIELTSWVLYRGATELLEVREIKNRTKKARSLRESEFVSDGVRWIHISQETLEPKGSVLVVMGRSIS